MSLEINKIIDIKINYLVCKSVSYKERLLLLLRPQFFKFQPYALLRWNPKWLARHNPLFFYTTAPDQMYKVNKSAFMREFNKHKGIGK